MRTHRFGAGMLCKLFFYAETFAGHAKGGAFPLKTMFGRSWLVREARNYSRPWQRLGVSELAFTSLRRRYYWWGAFLDVELHNE